MPRLNIDIEARYASFLDGLNRMERQTKGAADRMNAAWLKLGKSLAGLFAAERIFSFTKNVFDSIAALDDMAEATGASVESLSRFSQVARIGGNDVGLVTQAMVKLTSVLNKTDEESGRASEAFKRLNINLDDFRKLKSEDQFETIANALTKFKDGVGKTSVAYAIWGEQAARVLPLLKDIATFQGITATATGEAASQAENAANQWRKFGVQIESAAQVLAVKFLPTINDAITNLNLATEAFGGFFNALGNAGIIKEFAGAADPIKAVTDALDKLYLKRDEVSLNSHLEKETQTTRLKALDDEIERLEKVQKFYTAVSKARQPEGDKPSLRVLDPKRSGAKSSGSAFDESSLSIAFLRSNVALLDAEIAKAVSLYQEWIRNVDAIVEPVTRQADSMERLNEIYGLSESEVARKVASEVEEAAILAELNGAYESQVKQLFDVAGAYRRIADASDKARLALALAETASGKLAQQRADMEFFAAAMERGQISASEFSEIATAKLGLVAEATGNAKSAAEEFGLTLVSEAERAIVHWEGFGNLMRSIGADLKQFAARKLITEPLAAAVSGAFGAQTNGTGSLLNAGSSIAGLFSGSSAAASSAFTSFAFSGLGSSLGLSTAGTIAGPPATGAALSGSLTAGGAALGALASAAPYIAAVIAIASLFSGKGGGPKTEGSFDTANIERFFTATNSDDQAKAFVENLKASYADLAKQFGGVANEQLRLAFGFALDPQGTAQNAAHLAVGNSQFIIDQGRPDDFAAQAAEYLNRGILEALKQTDLYDSIDQLLDAFDPFTATSDQVTAEMDAITQALQNVIAAGEDYRQSIAAIAMQMQDSQNMFADSIRSIQLSQLDTEGQYQFLDAEAARFRDVLASLSDPALIKEYASKLNSTINSAFGLLDSGEQSRLAGSYIEKLTQSSQLTQDRLSAAAELQRAQFAELPAEIKKSIDAAMTTAVAAIQAAVSKGVTVDFRANVPGTTELALIG